MKTINLTVNGKAVAASVEPRTQLADFLRETLNLTGTHLGCEHGVCGACTLFIDGMPARSCITFAIACDGASITTIEGFDEDQIMRALREAFSREHALQCGYCTPGMLASARDTVMRMPEASEHEIRIAMSGNLCRCTGYVGIVRAIRSVIGERKAKGLSSPIHAATTLGPAGSGHGQPTTAVTNAAIVQIPLPPTAEPPTPSSRRTPGSSNTPGSLDSGPSLAKPQTTLQQSFSVAHPRAKVWEMFGRLGEVTACLPGTSLIGTPTENRVEPRIRVKLGPIVAEFEGVAEVVRDPTNHAGTIHGSARDTRSSSMTRGEIRYVLHEEKHGAATRVDLEIGYALTGALAQFSRSGLVQDIAKRMTAAFAQNLQARLDQGADAAGPGPVPAAELDAGSLIFSALWDRIKAFFRWLSGH